MSRPPTLSIKGCDAVLLGNGLLRVVFVKNLTNLRGAGILLLVPESTQTLHSPDLTPALPASPEATVPFFESESLPSCSVNRCSNGHEWGIQVGIAKCRGCDSPVLAIRMQNCPFCNEPASASILRTDWLAPGMGVAATCRGENTFGNSGVIEINHATPDESAGAAMREVRGSGAGVPGEA